MNDGINEPLYDTPRPLPLDDPAYWMLQRGIDEYEGRVENTGWITETHKEIYKASCYICTDPEFALMGLPICKPCPLCGVHWAADDAECDDGCDIYGYYQDGEIDES
jgi:hypothetical protein